MKRKKLRVALMSALIALGGTSLALGSLVSCGGESTEAAQYTVTYEASDDYTISIASGSTYAEGEEVSFTVTVASGKVLDSVTANGTELVSSDGTTYSFTMPNSNVTLVVTVSDAAAQYVFRASVSGDQYVGEVLTASATINGTATTDFTMSATSGSSLVNIDNTEKTVELLDEGEATILFTLVHEGVTLTDSVTLNIVDTSLDEENLLFTMDVDSSTNLKGDISSTYKSSGSDIRDKFDDVTIMYSLYNDIGIANASYGGYGDIGTYQVRSSSAATGDYAFESYEKLKITSITIDYYNSYSTLTNFLTLTVGDVSVSTPTILSTESTGVLYNNSYDIYKFSCQYYFGDNAEGYLTAGFANYASYFNNIKVYGEIIGDGNEEATGVTVSADNEEIYVGGSTTLSSTIEPNRRVANADSYTVEYTVQSGSEYVIIDGNVVTGDAAGTATILATATYDGNTVTGTTTITVISADAVQVDNISDITSASDYTVRGVVVSYNSKYAYIRDDTGGIAVNIQNTNAEITLDAYIQVSGTTASYNSTYWFNSSPTILVLTSTPDFTIDDQAVELDAATANSIVSSGSTIPTSAATKYKWTATISQYVGSSSYYDMFTLSGVNYTMETLDGGIGSYINVEQGSTYELEGYFVGYYNAGTYGYMYFMITSATEVQIDNSELESLYDNLEEVTVSDLLNNKASSAVDFSSSPYTSTTLYKVTGIVENITDSIYGNFYLTDSSTGESIYNYGCSSLYTNMSYSDGTYSYTNKGLFQTEGGVYSQITEGDEITVVAMLGTYNGVYRIASEFVEVKTAVANNKIYKIDSTLPSYITASKTEGIYYGEEITLTVDPTHDDLNGQTFASIYHNGNQLTETSENVYAFTAGVKNEITWQLLDVGEYFYTVEITAEKLGLGTSYSSSTSDVTIDGISFAWKDLMRQSSSGNIQNNYTTSGTTPRRSELWNTSLIRDTIVSITLNPGSYWTNTSTQGTVVFQVSFGTSEISDGGSVESYKEATYSSPTVTCDDSSASYFNIYRAGSGAAYLDSIVITLIGTSSGD